MMIFLKKWKKNLIYVDILVEMKDKYINKCFLKLEVRISSDFEIVYFFNFKW